MSTVTYSKLGLRGLRSSQTFFRLESSIASRHVPASLSRPTTSTKLFSTSRILSKKVSFVDFLVQEREKEAQSKEAIMDELRKDPRLSEDQAKAAFRTINILSNLVYFAIVGAGGWGIWKLYRWLGVSPVEPVGVREE